MRPYQQEVGELEEYVLDNFELAVFEAPPRAYFEIRGPNDSIIRGIHQVWALGVDRSSMIPELFDRFKLFVHQLQERGAVTWFWRRHVTFDAADSGELFELSARFVVLDSDLKPVKWPDGSVHEDGAPVILIP